MKQIFKIDNTEKQRILEMHIDATKRGYLNEQTSAKEFKTSTDSDRMYNFPNEKAKSANSKFGLQGDSKLENYYFTSTVADIVTQSKEDESQYLINFKPLSDAKTYVDYISINGKEITGSGTKTFDINKNSKIVATHNGLLAIKRVMDRIKESNYNGENAKLTVTIAGEERISKINTYDPNQAKNINPTANSLIRYIATLIFPREDRPQIDDAIANIIKSKTSDEIKEFIGKVIDSSLVANFLPVQKEWKNIKERYRLKGSESTNLSPLFDKAEKGAAGLNQKLWEDFWKTYRDTYLYNYSQYVTDLYPNEAQKLISDMSKSIQTQNATFSLSDIFYGLTKKKRYLPAKQQQNKESSGEQTYGTGQ